jgi:hypothetical protein
MAHLAHLPPNEALSSSTNAAWAKIDHDLMVQQASTVPYLNVILTSFFNSKMDLNCDIFDDNNDDLAQMCMK